MKSSIQPTFPDSWQMGGKYAPINQTHPAYILWTKWMGLYIDAGIC